MPSFRYTARESASGRTVDGAVEAGSRKDALRILAARGLVPVNVGEGAAAPAKAAKPAPAAKSSSNASATPANRARPGAAPAHTPAGGPSKRKLSRSLQLPFLSALGELIAAGIPVGDAIRILGARVQDPGLRVVSTALWTKVSEGASVARAMREMPEVFEDMTINLIEAGEATGNLKEILPRLTEHYERIAEVRSKLASALAYPAFIMVLAFGVVMFFLYFLLPRMKALFEALRGEIPLSTRLLIAGSEGLLVYGPFIAVTAVVFAIFGWQWRRSPAGRLKSDRWLLGLPMVGQFFVGADMLQATQTLSVLLANGIKTMEALRLTEANVSNRALREAFSETRVRVAEGATISGSLAQSPFIPAMDLDLLSIGEQTGNIVPSLRSIAQGYQRKQAKQIQAFLGVFSTGVLLLAFLLVGFIAYAIVSAVFGLSSSFKMR